MMDDHTVQMLLAIACWKPRPSISNSHATTKKTTTPFSRVIVNLSVDSRIPIQLYKVSRKRKTAFV
jgi:hypothetical protein